MLGGCVAAAIMVPTMAGMGYIFTNGKRVRAATPRPEPSALAQRGTALPPGVTLTELTELPPPSGLQPVVFTDPGWRAFFAYAHDRAASLAAEGPAQSALLAPQGAVSMRPDRRSCEDRTPAVLIDLDPGDAALADTPGTVAPPYLAPELDRLRQAGVMVVWISQTPADAVGAVGEALLRTGLDPTGRDPLLLIRGPQQRKQMLREAANRDVCLLAIAGDERSDFDELFDYLRGPPDATLFETLIGSGWFLVPPPLAPSPAP
ncbi:MAG: hypothetical protein B7Z08_13420 [Sphingomonadales bacterium 32-68-7]|nr:MAG: hypothetical protein B7Z08_13420 [Sphingomonadales bacterium 32-68-7]